MDLLTRIQVFSSVVDKGSFVSAAEALGISRPMASKHLARLEEDLGVRLLNRTTRRLALTEEGQAFYARCQAILEQIDEAVREAVRHIQQELKLQARISRFSLQLSGLGRRLWECGDAARS